MKKLLDIDYFGDNNPLHSLDMYLPNKKDFYTIVYFHGGGLKEGNKDEVLKFMPFVDRGIGVVSVAYRLIPDAKFPDFLYDGAKAVSYIIEHIKRFGGNGNVFIAGSSAGAYITMMLCLDRSYLEAVNVAKESVCGFISESAQQFAHFNLLEQRGFDSRLEQIDKTAPFYYVRDGIEIKPLLLLHYSDDMLCRPEENKLMYKSIRRFLPEDSIVDICEIKGEHCHPQDADTLIDAIYGFIRKCSD